MSSRTALRNCLYGINLNEGPLYFASNVLKDKLNFVEIANDESIPALQVLNSTLYNLWSCSPNDDIVKARINDRRLESGLRAKWNESGSIWSSFMLTSAGNSYRSSCVVRFKNENKENTLQYTRDIVDFAKSFGIPSIWKLVPKAGKMGYTVDVISCESLNYCNGIDRFEVLQVKYPSYHPSLDFRLSIFKSFDETRHVFELADSHLTLPEIKKFQHLAEGYSSKSFPTEGAYPNPFIVIEGLDGVGKTTLVNNLTKRLGAQSFQTPPQIISKYREIIVEQCQPVCRAFYSLGNYLIAENIKDSLVESPVVLDRFWHSSAAYAIATEAKCGGEINILPRGNPIYQWPDDLLKPSAVVYLELSESDRVLRMHERGEAETNEELQLKKSQLFRQRLIRAYKNMENPGCIVIDASKSREEVCENVIKELQNRKILPENYTLNDSYI